MNQKKRIASAILWAAAIIASAAIGAPQFLSVIVLPALAAVSMLITGPGSQRGRPGLCREKA